MCIDWETFRPLCRLQELQIYNWGSSMAEFRVQLDGSFAAALPLLRVLYMSLGTHDEAFKTTAKVVMPHLAELTIYDASIVHLDLQFMSALKRLSLLCCTVSPVSAACSTMVLGVSGGGGRSRCL